MHDVANDDGNDDRSSCSESTPGGSRHCSGISVVTTTTVAMTAAPCYDAVAEATTSTEELRTVTIMDQQHQVLQFTSFRQLCLSRVAQRRSSYMLKHDEAIAFSFSDPPVKISIQ